MNGVIMGVGRIEGLPEDFSDLLQKALEVEARNASNQINSVRVVSRARLLTEFSRDQLEQRDAKTIDAIKSTFGLNVVANCEATRGRRKVWCQFYAGEPKTEPKLYSAAGEGSSWMDAASDLAKEIYGSKLEEEPKARPIAPTAAPGTAGLLPVAPRFFSTSSPSEPGSLELQRLERLVRAGRLQERMYPALEGELAGRVEEALFARGTENVAEEYAASEAALPETVRSIVASALEKGAARFAAGTFVPIPIGRYPHGCNRATTACDPAEDRPSWTNLRAPFGVQAGEVSREAYGACVLLGKKCTWPAVPPQGLAPNGKLPIVSLTPAQAQAFCRWIGGRLPTEDEWEAAAGFSLGGGETLDGDLRLTDARKFANGFRQSGPDRYDGLAPSGSFDSLKGTMDLFGNASEMTRTTWPREPDCSGELEKCALNTRVAVKGGSYLSDESSFRISGRGFLDVSKGMGLIGFRCVREQ